MNKLTQEVEHRTPRRKALALNANMYYTVQKNVYGPYTLAYFDPADSVEEEKGL
jgi:hypothetical protein